jgi:hypothetical protein
MDGKCITRNRNIRLIKDFVRKLNRPGHNGRIIKGKAVLITGREGP